MNPDCFYFSFQDMFACLTNDLSKYELSQPLLRGPGCTAKITLHSFMFGLMTKANPKSSPFFKIIVHICLKHICMCFLASRDNHTAEMEIIGGK